MSSSLTKVTRRRFLRVASGLGASICMAEAGGAFFPASRAARASELPTLEGLSSGRLTAGATVNKENVEIAKSLLTPGTYVKVARYGMEMPIVPTTTDPTLLVPEAWLEATEQNRGQAVLDTNGQLWTRQGTPWVGGFPFPEPRTGLEAVWNFASFNWLEYADDYFYSGGEHWIKRGETYRTIDWIFAGIATVGRVFTEPRPHYPGHEAELYRLLLAYTAPFDYKGLSVLTIRPYDQRLLERSLLYVPALRRVREVSTTQRWESPSGNDIFRSDYNTHNDPLGNWQWRLVARQPMLLPGISEGYQIDRVPAVAGRFPRGRWELRSEVYVVEALSKDPTCPYGKKIFYIDGFMRRPLIVDFYDRQGKLWKNATYFLARLGRGKQMVLSLNHPHHCIDLQADHVTYLYVDPKPEVKNLGATIDDWWTEKKMMQTSF